MKTQKELFKDLLKNERPDLARSIWDRLDIFNWAETEKPELSGADIISILQRYLDKSLSGQQVEDWANLIEAADIALGGLGNSQTAEALHDLANPALEGALTPQSARALIDRLRRALS